VEILWEDHSESKLEYPEL